MQVQVQIQGAEQISSAKIATLQHQLVYRLQNYALDLLTPEHHSDALMVLAESDQIPTIIQIPRQIPRHELIKLMPLEWISNYEKLHTNTSPIQTTESMFERISDGSVQMTFRPSPTAPEEPPRLSCTGKRFCNNIFFTLLATNDIWKCPLQVTPIDWSIKNGRTRYEINLMLNPSD